MKKLIDEIARSGDCVVLPSSGFPKGISSEASHSDIVEFYTLCGGILFYPNSEYAIEIVQPKDFVSSNERILGEQYDDISASWYVIAQSGLEQFISIDLDPDRYGRCYDSFYDTHAVAGSCPIIAVSLIDLIQRLFRSSGAYWYWLDDQKFESIGDAYD